MIIFEINTKETVSLLPIVFISQITDSITQEKWAKCVDHVHKLISEDFNNLPAEDQIVEGIIIHLRDDSSDDDSFFASEDEGMPQEMNAIDDAIFNDEMKDLGVAYL